MAASLPSSAPERFGNLRRALTGPYTLLPVTVIVMIGWIWLRGLASVLAVDDHELASHVRVLVVVTIVVALVAGAVGWGLSWARARGLLRLGHTLVGYGLIGVALAVAPAFVGASRPAVLLLRLVLAIVFLTVMAYLLDTYQGYRSQMTDLEDQRLSLAQTRDQSQLAIVAARRQLTELIDGRIGPEVHSLLVAVQRLQRESLVTAQQLREVAASVRTVATEKVRSLSHQLSSAEGGTIATEPSWVNRFGLRQGVFAQTLRKLPGRRPFRPFAVGLTFGVGATSLSSAEIAEQAGMARAGAVVLGCLAVVAVIGAQLVGLWLWRQWIAHSRQQVQVLAVLVLYLLSGVFAAVAMYSVVLYSSRESVAPILIGVPIGVVTCSLVWCVIGLVSEQAHATASALRQAVVATRWEAQRTQQEEKQLHRAVSLALHGDVQSKLTINAMLLDDLANRVESEPAAVDLDSIVSNFTDLAASLDLLTSATDRQRDLMDSLDQLQADWAGFAVMHRDICAEVLASCRQSGALSEAVSQICHEAVSNAVRHGHADQIEITMRQATGELTIDIRDNGIWHENSAVGLGTTLLDELATSWELQPAPAGTTLTARLPAP